MNGRAFKLSVVLLCLVFFGVVVEAQEAENARQAQNAEPLPKELLGDWTLDLESKEPAWMSVIEKNGRPFVHMRVYIGSDGPFPVTEIVEGRIKFAIKPLRKNKKSKLFTKREVEVGLKGGKLLGKIVHTLNSGDEGKTVEFVGRRIPPMPTSAPDLSKIKFGKRVELFNGKDLSGWRTHETDKKNGWSAKDGKLINMTPKTDFSPTGAYANLRTEAEFEDFRLHIEFLVEEKRNSGIYLRGMYEAQVVDRDSPMQGVQGVGAIFGRIKPSKNAGLPGGQWQTYDLTLVDRHITVVLNGEKVINNQPISGPTAGAIYTDPASPGPIYLQGDHTNVQYRNIYLEPVVQLKEQRSDDSFKHLFTAKLLLKRLEPASLTPEQTEAFNNLSRALTQQVTKLRDEAGITGELIKQRDTAFSELKKSNLEGDDLWNALQEKTKITDGQRDAFRATKEAATKFRKDVIELLTKEQRAKIRKRPRQN